MEQEKIILDFELFKESQEDSKYGNKAVVNVIMAFLLKNCTDISQELLDKKIGHEDLFELLVLIPKKKKYYPLIEKIIEQLFNSRGFQNTVRVDFLRHFSDSPEVIEFYVGLEKDRIQRVNHGTFA